MIKANRIGALLLAGSFVIGCGGSNDPVFSTGGGGTSVSPTLSGRVRDQSGNPAGNVRVVAHERTTHAKLETMSNPDGSFSFGTAEGVYDLGLHRDDAQTATCFYGPVFPDAGTSQVFQLRGVQGRSPDEVFGKLYSRQDVPAGNRRLVLRPMATVTGGAIELDDVEVRTAADGSFSARINTDHELAMDLDIFDRSGTLDEWVDIGKLRKACYVELVTDTEAPENRLRANESEVGDQQEPLRAQVSNPPDGYIPYDVLVTPNGTQVNVYFRGGQIPVGSRNYVLRNLGDIPSFPTIDSTSSYYDTKLRVADNGMWWWDYAMNVCPGVSNTSWSFEDNTADDYSLSVDDGGSWHKVSYNSDSPDLRDFTTDFDTEQNF